MKFILMHAFRGRKSACIVSTFALFLENCIEDTQANEIKIQCCNGNRFLKKFWRNECVRRRRRWSPWQCIMVHLIWYLLRDNLSSNAFREQQKKRAGSNLWPYAVVIERVTNSSFVCVPHHHPRYMSERKFMVLNLVHSTLFAILLSGVWLLDDVGNAEKIKQPNKQTHTHTHRT